MKKHPPDKPSSLTQAYRSVGPYLTLGIQLIATILLGVFAGHWADGKFDTAPLWTLIGGLIGIAAGFYHFFKAVLKMDRKSEEDT